LPAFALERLNQGREQEFVYRLPRPQPFGTRFRELVGEGRFRDRPTDARRLRDGSSGGKRSPHCPDGLNESQRAT